MKFGIGHLNVVPCRAEPSDKSEQVTQLIFGELIKVYEKRQSWYRIKTNHDKYECWIDEKQFTFISEREFDALSTSTMPVVSDLAEVLEPQSEGSLLTVLFGSNLPNFKDGSLHFKNHKWKYGGSSRNGKPSENKSTITENALFLLNAPYQWGGRSPFGIDCSGFVQLVYKLNGCLLPRDASEQAKVGQALSFIEEAEPGDLAFFDNEEGIITHVGILLSNNRIIHASGSVRIDKMDHQGIFNLEKRDYTHRLRILTKIF